jgi:hypothetical protein
MADLDPGVVLSPSTIAAIERLTVTVQGRDWPATLGDFTLVGPADNQGACRWYERRHHNGTIEHIKVDHQLQPIKPMSTDLSVTPSPELVAKLWTEASAGRDDAPIGEIFNHGVYLAYAAGADQELEACCEWTAIVGGADALRAARRPKPPTLQERALQLLERYDTSGLMLAADQVDTIRRALEALDD